VVEAGELVGSAGAEVAGYFSTRYGAEGDDAVQEDISRMNQWGLDYRTTDDGTYGGQMTKAQSQQRHFQQTGKWTDTGFPPVIDQRRLEAGEPQRGAWSWERS
jgi:hypothetical protein